MNQGWPITFSIAAYDPLVVRARHASVIQPYLEADTAAELPSLVAQQLSNPAIFPNAVMCLGETCAQLLTFIDL